jgi:hypothetical protein
MIGFEFLASRFECYEVFCFVDMIRDRAKTCRSKKRLPKERSLKKKLKHHDYFDASSPLILAAEAVLKT